MTTDKGIKGLGLPSEVCSNLHNVGFEMEHFFNPGKYVEEIKKD